MTKLDAESMIGVVQVCGSPRAPCQGAFAGSGIVVARQWVVTWTHVIADRSQLYVRVGGAQFPSEVPVRWATKTRKGSSGDPCHLPAAAYTSGLDGDSLALLKARKPLDVAPVTFLQGVTTASLKRYTGQLEARGFKAPLGEWARSELLIHHAWTSASGLGGQTVGGVPQGMSGCPLLVRSGSEWQVIGLIQRGGEDAAVSSFVGADEIISFLVERLGPNVLRVRGAGNVGMPPVLWNVPALPRHYQARVELDAIKADLLKARPGAVCGRSLSLATVGMAGVGKTVLAAALARDEDVQRTFVDGVFWLTLGQTPEPILILQRRLLIAVQGTSEVIETLEHGKTLLRDAFARRSCLLVLDDVWDAATVANFDVLGEHCGLLVTTRNAQTARQLEAQPRILAELSPAVALAFLARHVEQPEANLPPEAAAIVAECGKLPLALAMVGSQLRGRTADRWPTLLDKLRGGNVSALKEHLPSYAYGGWRAAFAASIAALPEALRERYHDFAIFPEDTPIPERALEIQWAAVGMDRAAVQDAIDTLVDQCLARSDGRGILLHDLQLDGLRACATHARELHARLVGAYRRVAPEGLHCVPNDGYALQHLPYHVREASGRAALRELLFDVRWLYAKLQATDSNAVLADFELLDLDADGPGRLLRDAVRLSAHALARRPEELFGQLAGRLMAFRDPELEALVASAREPTGAPTLRPRWPRLTGPGGPLVRTFEHGEPIRWAALSADGKFATSGSEKVLKVWNVGTGALVRKCVGHDRWEALSRGGRFALCDGLQTELWQVGSATPAAIFKEGPESFRGFQSRLEPRVLSAEGRFALCANNRKKRLELRDLGSGGALV